MRWSPVDRPVACVHTEHAISPVAKESVSKGIVDIHIRGWNSEDKGVCGRLVTNGYNALTRPAIQRRGLWIGVKMWWVVVGIKDINLKALRKEA